MLYFQSLDFSDLSYIPLVCFEPVTNFTENLHIFQAIRTTKCERDDVIDLPFLAGVDFGLA